MLKLTESAGLNFTSYTSYFLEVGFKEEGWVAGLVCPGLLDLAFLSCGIRRNGLRD
jgi:hypothetical protein